MQKMYNPQSLEAYNQLTTLEQKLCFASEFIDQLRCSKEKRMQLKRSLQTTKPARLDFFVYNLYLTGEGMGVAK